MVFFSLGDINTVAQYLVDIAGAGSQGSGG